jgi:hypothetical protein
VLKEVFGLDVPDVGEDIRNRLRATERPAEWVQPGWEYLPPREAGPGAVLHLQSLYEGAVLPLHVGVVAKPGYVLHNEAATGAIIQRYDRPPLARRVIGAYRYGV